MTDFVVSIAEPEQLAGISWAREQHNAALPAPAVEEGDPPPAPEGWLETDADYIQWVMAQAAASYAQQQAIIAWQDEVTQRQSRRRHR